MGAADLELFTKCAVYLNGGLLSMESSVECQRITGAQEVDTVALGFAGVSPGSPRARLKIKNAVPSSDFEADPGPFMKKLKPVELTLFAAGRTATIPAFILDDNFTHAVNTPSSLEISAVGKFPDWT